MSRDITSGLEIKSVSPPRFKLTLEPWIGPTSCLIEFTINCFLYLSSEIPIFPYSFPLLSSILCQPVYSLLPFPLHICRNSHLFRILFIYSFESFTRKFLRELIERSWSLKRFFTNGQRREGTLIRQNVYRE